MNEAIATAQAQLLGADARRDAENLEDTGSLWMGRELTRQLRDIARSTIGDITAALAEVRSDGWKTSQWIEQLFDTVQLEQIKWTEDLLAEMKQVARECDERIPAANPAYRHVWREFRHAVVQHQKAEVIIEYIERAIREHQQNDQGTLKLDLAFLKIQNSFSQYLEQRGVIEDQFLQITT